jgi:hypothetical protein
MTEADIWAYDWAQIGSRGVLLHAPVFTDQQRADLWEDVAGTGSTLCGQHDVYLHIPGVLSRMGADRCERCCDRAGYPHGRGSPKNDDNLRTQLGLNTTKEHA